VLRGDIWLVDFGQPIGKRPAIIVSRGSQDNGNPLVMVVRTTTKQYHLQYPYTFEIEPTKENGLDDPSVALVYQMFPIRNEDAIHKIGHLENRHMAQIIAKLKELLRIS